MVRIKTMLAKEENSDGSSVSYEYDAWGKITATNAPNVDAPYDEELANINPLRYRGYYFDNETGYYYLQSRYYDPNICRFINSDIYDMAQMSRSETNGLNLFLYCNNNAINNIDSSGFFNWDSLKQKVHIITKGEK